MAHEADSNKLWNLLLVLFSSKHVFGAWRRERDDYFCSHARNKFLCVALKIESLLLKQKQASAFLSLLAEANSPLNE
jgi:hypothetical protein